MSTARNNKRRKTKATKRLRLWRAERRVVRLHTAFNAAVSAIRRFFVRMGETLLLVREALRQYVSRVNNQLSEPEAEL